MGLLLSRPPLPCSSLGLHGEPGSELHLIHFSVRRVGSGSSGVQVPSAYHDLGPPGWHHAMLTPEPSSFITGTKPP